MADYNLTQKLKDKMAPRPRVRGRYNSSELWGIVNGYTTPEQWLNAAPRAVSELLSMWAGIGAHNQIQELLGVEYAEKKIEYKYKDIVLVAKADYMPPHADEVWEFKTSDKRMDKSKPWHDYQVRLYASMFNKPRGLVYQPLQDKDGVYLKHLSTVTRDDAWFEGELEKLYQFHLKVENLLLKQSPK